MLPTNFPDLSGAKRISIDLETYDPGIEAGLGTGALRGGHIAGIAVGTDDGFREYYPVGHQQGENLDFEKIKPWFIEQFGHTHQEKVGANIMYDLEYLAVAGIPVAGRCLDVQIAEPLLDENSPSYSLESIARKYLGEGKDSDGMHSWLASHFGGKSDRKNQAKNIWRAPYDVVRSYAISDIDLPLRIIELQIAELHKQELYELFLMESDLIPMMLAMKLRGVKVDIPRAQRVYDELTTQIQTNQGILGMVNVNASRSLASLWDSLGLSYTRTAKTGAPSFTKETLAACSHPMARVVEKIKKDTKLRDTFIKNSVMESQIKGRIHCQFNQLRSDEYGTVSGRFSSSNPNLQQIPAKGEGTKLIRTLFVPDDDNSDWVSIDYSQIEYRCFAHYSEDEDILRAYEDPKTDFHQAVSDMLGGTLDRKITKTFNFGILYGAGFKKIATMLRTNMTHDQCEHLLEDLGEVVDPAKFKRSVDYINRREPFTPDLYDQTAWRVLEVYDEKFPAAKKLMNKVSEIAKGRGYIYTILQRRRRFEKGESVHKALNALLQGSAADIMKKGMVDVWKSGVCDVLGAPLLTVHDELDWSVPRTPECQEAIQEVNRLMKCAIALRVPIETDVESGPNWGEVK